MEQKKKKGKHNFIIQQLSDNWCQVVKKHTLVLDVIQHKMAIITSSTPSKCSFSSKQQFCTRQAKISHRWTQCKMEVDSQGHIIIRIMWQTIELMARPWELRAGMMAIALISMHTYRIWRVCNNNIKFIFMLLHVIKSISYILS